MVAVFVLNVQQERYLHLIRTNVLVVLKGFMKKIVKFVDNVQKINIVLRVIRKVVYLARLVI